MIKIKMSSDFLKQMVDVLNVYDVDAPIVFTEDKAIIKVIDLTRTAMIIAEIDKSAFIEYEVSEEEEVICMPKDKVNSILKALKDNVTIESSNGLITFSSGRSKFNLHNISYDENLLKLSLRIDFDTSFDLTAEQFKYVFDITSIFNQYTVITFKSTEEGKEVSFRSDSDTDGSADIVYAENELKNVVGERTVKSAFSSSYFKGLMKLKPNRYILEIDDSKPIKVTAPLMEGKCKCTILVAPVILDEE